MPLPIFLDGEGAEISDKLMHITLGFLTGLTCVLLVVLIDLGWDIFTYETIYIIGRLLIILPISGAIIGWVVFKTKQYYGMIDDE